MKDGNILFLTRRHKKPFYRILVSKGIALFTKKTWQPLEEVKVHAAIIYNYFGKPYVREMEKKGDLHWSLEDYLKNYKGRIEIKENPYSIDKKALKKFRHSCRHLRVKYDFWNTFFFQVLKKVIGGFIGRKTNLHRMCAEDARKQFNILKDVFTNNEEVNPNDFYFEIEDWKTIYKDGLS